jgi:3-oxoacid CoA-transferase subunit B
VFSIDKHGGDAMSLIERAEGISLDEIRSKTEASFTVTERAKAA